MRFNSLLLRASLLSALSNTATAHDFEKLDEALPTDHMISGLEPVFDFDSDGCLPSAGISRSGQQNGGLNTTGGLTSGCRSSDFLQTSNTLHRYACTSDGSGNNYCADFYALYFEKDQIDRGGIFGALSAGHRHDWEYAAIWTKNGAITHASYSAHGDLYTQERENLPFEGTHVKFVYHKEGVLTHALRFAEDDETAENPYGHFVTPTITSWYELTGDELSNIDIRNRLNQFSYDRATIPLKDQDQKFTTNLNEFRPSSYPEFSFPDVRKSNPNPEEIQIFEHCGYQGKMAILAKGDYLLEDLQAVRINNNTISSLKNPQKLAVTLAEENYFLGEQRTPRTHVSCLGDFNDKVSSLIIR